MNFRLIYEGALLTNGSPGAATTESGPMNVGAQFTRVLFMAVPVALLLAGSVILFLKQQAPSSFLQLLGGGFLVVVVLAHLCEALHLLPSMGWGLDRSPGHYLDAGSLFSESHFFRWAICFTRSN
jgi:hypothetical protein